MSEIKLLPCPFCGGEARLDNSVANAISVECTVCYASSPIFLRTCDREQKAIKLWNTRKPMERILERIKEKASSIYQDKSKGNQFVFIDDINDIFKEEGGIE